MVTEVATLVSKPGCGDLFEEELAGALKIVLSDIGALRASSYRQVENSDSFKIFIEWESVQHHEDFRATSLFQEYRAHLRDVLERVEDVAHYQTLSSLQ